MTMQQPMYGTAPMFVFGDYPMPCTCPNCRQQIVTRIEKQNGLLTWIVMGFLVLLCCWCGCCLIPLCIDTYKDTAHFCPNCSYPLGVRQAF